MHAGSKITSATRVHINDITLIVFFSIIRIRNNVRFLPGTATVVITNDIPLIISAVFDRSPWQYGILGAEFAAAIHTINWRKLSTLYDSNTPSGHMREIAVGYAISLKERTVGANLMCEMVNYWMRVTFL